MPLTPLQRKVKLIEVGVSQYALAKQLGVTQSHVSEVIRGMRRSQRVERAVCDAIGLSPRKVFPPRTRPLRVSPAA